MKRIDREKKVVAKMISGYCRRKHRIGNGVLCDDCRHLLQYAAHRLDRCPKGESKTSCRKCEIHCYSPDERTRIRNVMAYMGPRMLIIDPLNALIHLYHELK